jgi:hypothetical protein
MGLVNDAFYMRPMTNMAEALKMRITRAIQVDENTRSMIQTDLHRRLEICPVTIGSKSLRDALSYDACITVLL